MQYTVGMLARDLDQVLLESDDTSSVTTTTITTSTDEDRPRAVLRVRLMLRYLALLAGRNMEEPSSDDSFVPNTTQSLSLIGLP